ncbi:MAG: ABC transporter permease [Bacteroidales bacterium]|jgi:ABC-2 type transport system permease protein|nr:ABC transporter permease [Bacteroidales bacterium]MDD2686896.1 ABC transporter permease [Bacteroidales bacterium]MDD3329698.1 ABC transporter permease [Bacteroidales bacterium]MDD3690512.1 ABC transporter permease [Bacteroidales bacterium]MDD4044708.1 ABC transporter permease [Bacteroidales bacterium]
MRTILILIKKEFIQIFRNPVLARLITILPLAYLFIFPFSADMEIKSLQLAIIDYDHSSFSREIRNTLKGSQYFKINDAIQTKPEAEKQMKKDKIDLIIEIPNQFEEKIFRQENPSIGITANAVNNMKASIGVAYIQQFLSDYMVHITKKQTYNISNIPTQINPYTSRWFNKKMDYKNIFVPGILAVLVSMIGCMLSTLNIVREKELGTIEQMNVTPISKWQFFSGKLIPFWIIGMLEFGIGLVIMNIVFDITIQGSVFLLLVFTAIFLVGMLGLGFVVSIFSKNQVQATYIMMFLFIIFILLSGLFTPIDSMPTWGQTVNIVNPIAHFMEILKYIILKGTRFQDLYAYFFGFSAFALIINAITITLYKNTSK